MGQLVMRILLGTIFIFVGGVHLIDPRLLLPIMPRMVPWPLACIIVSGVFEILGGIGLLIPNATIQLLAGWGLLVLLVAVFPANIHMAVEHIKINGHPRHDWVSWARLPLQPVIMLAVSWSCHIWPTSPSPA